MKSDMETKKVKDITNCVKTMPTSENSPTSALLKWMTFNGIDWENILVVCYEESHSNRYLQEVKASDLQSVS